MAFQGMQFPSQQQQIPFYEAFNNQQQNAIDQEMGMHKNQIKGAEAQYAPQNEAEKYAQSQSKSFMDQLEAQYKEQQILQDLEYKHAMALNQERMSKGIGLSRNGGIEGDTAKERRRVWDGMGADAKAEWMSHAAPLGLDPVTLLNKFINEGMSLEDIYKEQGVEMGTAQKSHLPTTSNRTNQKEIDAGEAELTSLDEFVGPAMQKYSRTFFNYSPEQVMEAISGENEDDQARFLAARALQPEIIGARIKMTKGSNAAESLKHAQQDSLTYSKVFQGLVSPNVFRKTQEYINEELKKAVGARRKVIYNETQTDKKIDAIKKAEMPSKEDMEYMKKKHNMTEEQILKLIKEKRGG
jgi:hypothetical protein